MPEACEFALGSPYAPRSAAFAQFAGDLFSPNRSLLDAMDALTQRVHAQFEYKAQSTDVATDALSALQLRHGVCQDFAHVMIGGLRSLGLPARYVSGYLRSRRKAASDAKPCEGELVGSEASHAGVAAWCPALGWIEVDPTNDLVPSDRHIVLAWGRDYDDVSPVKGVTLGGGSHTVDVTVRVQPIAEPPRG